ncbi:MAG TPA: hypothetical protein VE978_26675 [Chitinophagales bacterium]|nr:hypothetical protein [Chitinophagales bacterium]
MSADENKFDEILREKFSSKDFPFDEENWERAEKKIDADRKKKKLWRLAFIFFLGLSAGIAVMIPFVNHETQSGNKIVSPPTETIKPGKSLSENANKNDNSSSEPANQNKNAEVETKNASAQKNADGNEKYISAKSNSLKNELSIGKESIPASAKDINPSETSVSKNKTGKRGSQFSFDSVASSDNVSTPVVISQNVIANANTIHENPISENHPGNPQSTNDTSDNAIVPLIPGDTVKATKDSSVTAFQESAPAEQPQLQNSTCVTIFSIEAGTTYLFGWQYDVTVEGRGFNPVSGIGVTHFFNTKWAIYTGMQYGSVAHLNVSEKRFTTLILDFGENYVDTTIATKWIHYAVVPLFVQYHFGNKNFIGIGGSVAHLVNTTSDLIITKHSDFKDVEQLKTVSLGYIEGFNSWNASVALAYGRGITGKFRVSAEVHCGLFDIKDNTFFSTQTFERSTGIKLLLSYDLCNH